MPRTSSSTRRAARSGSAAAPPAAAPRRAAAMANAVASVRRLVRGLRLAEQRTRAEVGLSAAQHFVLTTLTESAAASLSDLAERTLTDRSSVAAVVERLEESGLVASERSTADRRRVLVRITPLGRRKLQAAPTAPTTLLVEALGRLGAAELQALDAQLARLVEEMGLAGEPATMLFEETMERRGSGDGR